MAICTDNWEPGSCSLTPEFSFLLLLTIWTARTNSHHMAGTRPPYETQGGSLNAVVFIRKAALSLGFSVNFIPSSLTKMSHLPVFMASFYKLPFDFRSCSYGCIDPWEPPGLPYPSCPSSSTQKHSPSLSPAAASQSKGTWVTSPAPDFVQCASHGFPWEEGCHSGKGGGAIWDGVVLSQGKQTYQNVLLCHDEAEDVEGSSE